MQGVFLLLGVLIVIAIAMSSLYQQTAIQGFAIGALVLGIVTAIDDRAYYHDHTRSPPARVRLGVQIGVAILAIMLGDLMIDSFVRQGEEILVPAWFAFVFSVSWFVLTINALNRFDGVSGNTSGISTIGFITIASLITWVVIPAFPDIDLEHLTTLQTTATLARIMGGFALLYAIIEIKPW